MSNCNMRQRVSNSFRNIRSNSVRYELLNEDDKCKKWSFYKKIGVLVVGLFCIAIILAIVLALIIPAIRKGPEFKDFECVGGHETYDTNGTSVLGKYKKFAVAADNEYCSKVGADILRNDGSAIDAAIATGLCNGIAHCQSSGIGGGHFMVIYLGNQNASYAIDARETAPINSDKNMFVNHSATVGGLATGIPGEISGYWEAYKLGGKLPWKKLFEPAIKMCRDGFPIPFALGTIIQKQEKNIRKNDGLTEIFLNQTSDKLYNIGDIIKMPKLAKTLEIISEKNIEAFYNGSLTPIMVDEINENGGNVLLDDFITYKALVKRPIQVKLKDDFTFLTQPPPSSGILVSFVLRIMSKFNLNNQTHSDTESTTLYLHRLIETFKHTYYQRSLLGDENIEDMAEFENKLMSQNFLNEIFNKIVDSKTFPSSYYGDSVGEETPGTTHISVLNGNDAVALSSTVNTYFGAKYVGKNTGIIYNDEMDDFSTPGLTNFFGLKPSPINYIKPGKRPMSSMSPSIVLDNNGSVRLVLGGSGGSKILSSVAQVAIENLWINSNIKDSIDYKRVHHQLFPEKAQIEVGFDQEVINNLAKIGHKLQCISASSIVQGITKFGTDRIEANCDNRKGGVPDGR